MLVLDTPRRWSAKVQAAVVVRWVDLAQLADAVKVQCHTKQRFARGLSALFEAPARFVTDDDVAAALPAAGRRTAEAIPR